MLLFGSHFITVTAVIDFLNDVFLTVLQYDENTL